MVSELVKFRLPFDLFEIISFVPTGYYGPVFSECVFSRHIALSERREHSYIHVCVIFNSLLAVRTYLVVIRGFRWLCTAIAVTGIFPSIESIGYAYTAGLSALLVWVGFG